jgi:hypothetical protein
LLEPGAVDPLGFAGEGDGIDLGSPLPLRERVGREVGGAIRRFAANPAPNPLPQGERA